MLRSLLPRHLRPRREKVFGDGPRIPLDREAKVRIMHFARVLKHRSEPRKHYGVLTGKFVDVLNALLWLVHDGRSGQCNPSYATIADKAGCAPSTVGEAINALENTGILSWVNRIRRIGVRERDLFGYWMTASALSVPARGAPVVLDGRNGVGRRMMLPCVVPRQRARPSGPRMRGLRCRDASHLRNHRVPPRPAGAPIPFA